jgi:LCP family protein required for cell wall assembly
MNKFGVRGNDDNVTGNKKNSAEDEFDVMQLVDELAEDEILHNDFMASEEQDELLEGINESLAMQISEQLDDKNEIEVNIKKPHNKLKIISFTFLIMVISLYLLILTPFGKNFILKAASEYAHGKMNYQNGSEDVIQIVEDDVIPNIGDYSEEDLVDSNVNWNIGHIADGGRKEEGVINILLLGEEAIESGGGRGRTDLMIIATLNSKTKEIKLTSLMRDLLVQIPGYKDNKLNAAYEIGGVPLLYNTIELNFDIKLDGYAMVGFSDFEKIIDELGGVTITLTETEAKYLRTTNYIADPLNRNVVSGTSVLNGGQALGYCRIRYVATKDNQMDDYGRTSRQRVLLNAIFDKYKSKSLPELVLLLNDILPLITTDITRQDFEQYLNIGVSMGLTDIENLRIPVKNSFDNGFVRKMAVLIPDLQKNIEELHKFVFE